MNSTVKTLSGFLLLVTMQVAVSAQEKQNEPSLGIKVGMGFDQGFGITAQFYDNINAFIGNDGFSADYILKKGAFQSDVPINWYVGVGGAMNWNKSYNSYSARVPLGVSFPFAKGWDVYGQIAPDLAFNTKQNDTGLEFGVDLGLGIRYDF